MCQYCFNWNPSPIESRWEVVDACERRYRETTVRVSTGYRTRDVDWWSRSRPHRQAFSGDAERYNRRSGALRVTRRKNSIFRDDDAGVLGPTAIARMALGIAVYEDAERQRMPGELSALEDAWREAEAIAVITDDVCIDE